MIYAIDFGTSNSLLAAAEGNRVVPPIPLDPRAPDPSVLKSVLYSPSLKNWYFGAAAVEQLTVWSKRVGAEIVTGTQGADPASVAHRAVARALELHADVCIVDTAGRLHTQTNLMEELAKVRRVIAKLIPEAPHETLISIDATTSSVVCGTCGLRSLGTAPLTATSRMSGSAITRGA